MAQPNTPIINRAWCAPSAATFEIKPIRELLSRWLTDKRAIVDPFARGSQWGSVTNDINPQTSAHHHMDATAFAKMLADQGYVADAILFDPPYSLEQAKRCYEMVGRHFAKQDAWDVNRWTRAKDHLSDLLEPGGIVISFGWHSSGFGLKRGYSLEEILMVCHGAGHHDTICTVERKLET
jgi:hypothetical protein